MKTLIIYDSFFGNTEQIAQAIGQTLDAQTVKVNETSAEQLAGIELLIVGSPTRGFRPSPLIAAFLKGLPANCLQGVKVAAFDTRIPMTDKVPRFLRFLSGLFGYAAQPIAKALQQKSGTLALPAEGFLVTDSKGPLSDGEIERATAWAQSIAEV